MKLSLFFAIPAVLIPLIVSADPLPGTQPLDWQGDLAAKMVDGIHTFLDRELIQVAAARRAEWKAKMSPEFVEAKRAKLKATLGLPLKNVEDRPSGDGVAIPGRDAAASTGPGGREVKIPPREWLWRTFAEEGVSLQGREVAAVLAGVEAAGGSHVAVSGDGDAGWAALLAAAIDPRIEFVHAGGCFEPMEMMSEWPIDRTAFGFLRDFGAAELLAMIAPRHVSIQTGGFPDWKSPGQPAAPGRLRAPSREDVAAELTRAKMLSPGDWLAVDAPVADKMPLVKVTTQNDGAPFKQWLDESQHLMRESEYTRREFWKKADFSSAEKFAESAKWYRDYFWTEITGKLPPATLAPNPRSRIVYDTDKFRGWEVVLDVYPDVFAEGILLLPKDLKPGEKRPVVVCQHGLEGRPTDVADPQKDNPAYHAFAARLAEQGYIVFAPQNPYIGEDRFRTICRKAWPLKLSLWSFIMRQHETILKWLGGLDGVDPARIAFYGLSYGGKSAMRIPALLDGYCLSICSADYNEWIWKNCDARSPLCYLYTREYDMVEWNLANTFNYAELSWLIFPRPFMVERGHDDGVSCDEWVAYEFARTRRHYDKLGLGDRTEIEFFNGPHTINGKGTFEFLKKHLRWK